MEKIGVLTGEELTEFLAYMSRLWARDTYRVELWIDSMDGGVKIKSDSFPWTHKLGTIEERP